MDDNCVCIAFSTNIKGIVNSVKRNFEAVFLEDDGVMNAVKIKNSIRFDQGDGYGVADQHGIGDH